MKIHRKLAAPPSTLMQHPMPKAAYVHVPFCHHRCPYCNFTLVANRSDWIDRYLTAIEIELSQLGQRHPIETLFIGGGTPTLLDEFQLDRLLSTLHRWFLLDADGEWSIEANPNDLTASKCQLLSQHGINRVSVGGQSFNAKKLETLGRDHNGKQLRDALEQAKAHFSNVSVDLIFGAPGESPAMWIEDLDSVLQLGIQHVSTYGLTFEKGAAYWGQVQKGQILPVAEEIELEMYLEAIDRLTNAGMQHYEISSFAFPGYACRHNCTYWEARPWWGFGPGAAGFVDGNRYCNHRSTSKYLQRIESGLSSVAESEVIDWSQWTRERWVFGMRRLEGIDWLEIERVGEPGTLQRIRPIVDDHILRGWFIQEQSRVRLSPTGLAISDALWPEYL